MMQTSTAVPVKTTLIDVTKCIGCKACQVACKNWNDLDGVPTELQNFLSLQNPAQLDANTYTLISSHELADETAPGGLRHLFVMQRCLHCLAPACVSACPTTALHRLDDGPVSYDPAKCIGCRYCMWACPWGVPTAEWDALAPKIQKCTHCTDRSEQPVAASRNEQPLTEQEIHDHGTMMPVPACVKACPADALHFGSREDMLEKARGRITARPGKYIDHIYGEHEAGGTSVLYLSSVPFEKLGLPTLDPKPYPAHSSFALHAVPPAVIAVGAALGGIFAGLKRRATRVALTEPRADAHDHHVEFARVDQPLWTPFNKALLALVALGAISMVLRFVFGLGRTTNLSDTYAWGLWIVFDLVWIAVAAGAFAAAGIIYVFRRKDLYAMGRAAVLMGLLSYSFVMVTLVADLGLPWNSWQLAFQAPAQSAMFEVSWCVGLYITILLLEFLPVPLEHMGLARAMETWRRWQGAYVAFALALFVYLLSRNFAYAAVALAVFGFMAWAFRDQGKHHEPIMLAIAAVTLSTMHQSSLGSLFLLMPDKLAPQWWSPVMPVSFFLSAIASGTALVVLIAMWIAKGWNRTLRMDQLASMGAITFWSLLVYLAVRLGDMALRGQLATAFTGPYGVLFVVEVVLLGIVPLVLLSQAAWRSRRDLLLAGTALTVMGVVLNRVNVVVLAMNLKGTRPQFGPEPYSPSLVEWGVSIGLIALTIFLFKFAARLWPVLPRDTAEAGHPSH